MWGRARLRLGVVLLCLQLAACAGWGSWAAYVPYVVEIQGQPGLTALRNDLALCQGYAKNYPAHFNFGQVAVATFTGAVVNTPPGIAAGPAAGEVIGFGALQGLATATIGGLNLLPQTQRRVVIQCLTAKGEKSGLYMVLDPE